MLIVFGVLLSRGSDNVPNSSRVRGLLEYGVHPKTEIQVISLPFHFGSCNAITGLMVSRLLGWIWVAFVWAPQRALGQCKVFIIISTKCGPSILPNSHSAFCADFLPEDPNVSPSNWALILTMAAGAENQISRQRQICSLKSSSLPKCEGLGGIFVLQMKSGKWWRELLSLSERLMPFWMVLSLQPHLAAH